MSVQHGSNGMSTNHECNFFFEVIAPNGLDGIEESVKKAGLGLYVYKTGFNNKNILKAKKGGFIELNMDTSTIDLMHASGHVEMDFAEAKMVMEKLSNVFKDAGYRRKIVVDDSNGENTACFEYQRS